MKYQDKSFTVAMPGKEAKQWPRCVCGREWAHKGSCKEPEGIDAERAATQN